MSLSPMKGTTSASDFIAVVNRGVVTWAEYEKLLKSDSPELTCRHQHDFYHKHEPTTAATHVCYGHHVLSIGAGDQLLCIHNAAMWSSAVLSYSIHLENSSEEEAEAEDASASSGGLINSTGQCEEVSVQPQEMSEDPSEQALREQKRLEHGLAALSGPLELLREGLRGGASLRERIRSQWERWQQLQVTANQVTTRIESEVERLLSADFSEFNSDEETDVYKRNVISASSKWARDAAAIRRIVLQLDPSESLKSARSLSTKLLLDRYASGTLSRSNSSGSGFDVNGTSSSPINTMDTPEVSSHQSKSPVEASNSSSVLLEVEQQQVVFSSAQLKIKPGGDFRCPLRMEHKVGIVHAPLII